MFALSFCVGPCLALNPLFVERFALATTRVGSRMLNGLTPACSQVMWSGSTCPYFPTQYYWTQQPDLTGSQDLGMVPGYDG